MLVDRAQQINLVDPFSCFNVRPGGCVEGGRRGSHSLPFSTPAGGRLRLGHRSGVVPVGAWGTLRLVIKFVNVMYFFTYMCEILKLDLELLEVSYFSPKGDKKSLSPRFVDSRSNKIAKFIL